MPKPQGFRMVEEYVWTADLMVCYSFNLRLFLQLGIWHFCAIIYLIPPHLARLYVPLAQNLHPSLFIFSALAVNMYLT